MRILTIMLAAFALTLTLTACPPKVGGAHAFNARNVARQEMQP